jgi:hypothetical protein
MLRLSRKSLKRGIPFRDFVQTAPEITSVLTRRRLASVLDYRRHLGLAPRFVDEIVARHRVEKRARRAWRP